MKIKYWTGFSKRKNSTKQPSTGTQVDVYLKEDTSILNPVFECVGVPENVNYIRVDDWNRYYFVNNVQRIGNDRILIDCEVDVLASYKSNIGATSALVSFTSSSSKKTILDDRNRMTSIVDVTPTSVPWSSSHFSDGGGCYIVGVMNEDSNGEGGVLCYYAMEKASLTTLSNHIFDANIMSELGNQFLAVQESLVSVTWVPLDYSKLLPGTSTNVFKIGRATVGGSFNVKKLTARVITGTTGTVTLGYSAISGSSGAGMTYLELAPYTTGVVYLPFVGLVPLNVELAAFTKNIQIDYTIDILTGDIVYELRHGGVKCGTYNGNICTKMPTSSAAYDAIGVATGTLETIGGVIATGVSLAVSGAAGIASKAAGKTAMEMSAVSGAVTAGKGALNTVASMKLHTMLNGANSSAIGAHIGLNPYVLIYQNQPTMTNLLADKAITGMPYYEVATISSLSGYVQCEDAFVDMAGLADEKEVVNGYLNSGFYYE